MQPIAANRKADAFDMAKLQKSLKQQQRRSQSNKPQVAKLSPAEIRSLNQHASAATEASKLSPSATSSSRRPSASTPPITPDHTFHRPLPRSSTVPLPTPPRSPVKEHRRDSQRDPHRDSLRDLYREHHHSGRGRPHSNGKAVNGYSRTSSTSSYRSGHSLPTYRGHEVTQTGSKIMLQRPQQEIVTNPLSMFSRPRQSQLQAETSPDKFKRNFLDMDASQAEAMLDSEPNAPTISSRAPSPPRMTDSPVSADEADDPKQALPINSAKGGTSPDDKQTSRPTPSSEQRSESDETIKAPPPDSTQLPEQPEPNAAEVARNEPVEQQTKEISTPQDSQVRAVPADAEESRVEKKSDSARKRFTFHHAFNKKQHDELPTPDRKMRRNTLSFTKSPENSPQLVQESPKSSSNKTAPIKDGEDEDEDDDSDVIPSHPAVRPPSIRARSASTDSHSRTSSLPPLTTSGPTYGRCACCGKIKRPHGYGTELSPVMENEHLRTNFSFEAERTSIEARRYTPIIPIEIKDKDDAGSIRTVQATIEPKQSYSGTASIRTSHSYAETSHSNRSSASFGSNQTVTHSSLSRSDVSPISKSPERLKPEEPRIVRFSSLHGSRGGSADALAESAIEEEIVQSVPFVQPIHQSLVPPAQTHHRMTLLPQQKLQQPQQQRHSAMPIMSGAVQRPPHPLRQSSPIDSMVDELQSTDGSILDAQQQEIKRVPKQDVITVVPVKQYPAASSVSPQDSPVESSPTTNILTSNGSNTDQSSEYTPKKLQKNNPTASPTKARRMSLPTPHKFRLPGARRGETIPLPYSAALPGPPPETDPALRPPLPSQAPSARTSMSSAAEIRDRQAALSAAASRRTSRSQDRAGTSVASGSEISDQQQINSIATGTISDSTGKHIRPSPSFARFIQNLPATHASNVPEAKKFGWRRRGSKQQGVTPIAENDGEAGVSPPDSVGGKTPRAGRSRAASVTGVSAAASQALPPLATNGDVGGPSSLPRLQLGGRLSSSGTVHRLVNGDGGVGTKEGGFVGGLKLEQMLERERAVGVA